MLREMPAHFVQIADAITNRIAELLGASVCVTNDRGIVITSSEPHQVGLSFNSAREEQTLARFLRIPLRHNTEQGEVIVGTPGNREIISSRLAHALVELVINQTVTQKYLPSQQEQKDQLIYDLLHGHVHYENVTLNQAKYLGMDLNQPRAVILIDASEYILKLDSRSNHRNPESVQKHRAQAVISSIVSFFHLPNDTICADLEDGKVCVLKASNTKNLDPWASSDDISEGLGSSWANLTALKRAADALLLRLRSDLGTSISIGIGRYHPGIRGLAKSYEDARVALSLGERFQGHNRVHCLAELGIAAFIGVADELTKIDLAKYLLSPLDQEPELLTTLEVFFSENCCPSSTAKRLLIHRNTLSYRLDKIASLTGLEARNFDHAVQMRISLLLRSLQSTAME